MSLADSPVQQAPEVIESDLDSDEATEEEEEEEPPISKQAAVLDVDLGSENDAPAAQDASFEIDEPEQDVQEAVGTPLDHSRTQVEEDELDASEDNAQVLPPDSQLTEQSQANSIEFVEYEDDVSMDQVHTEESVSVAEAPSENQAEGSVEEDDIEDGESDDLLHSTPLVWHSQVMQEPVPDPLKSVQQEEHISLHLDEEPPKAEPALDDMFSRAASSHPDDTSTMKPDVLQDQEDEPSPLLPATLPMAPTEPIVIEEEIQESSNAEFDDISPIESSVVPPEPMIVETEPPLDALHNGGPEDSLVALPEDIVVEKDSSQDKPVVVESPVASAEPTIALEVIPQDEDISPVVQEVASPSFSVDREPSPIVDEEPAPRYHYSIDSLPLPLIEVILKFIPDVESLQSSALVCQRFHAVLSQHPEWFASFLDDDVSSNDQQLQSSEESPGSIEMEVVEESSLESPVLPDTSQVLKDWQMSPMLNPTDTADTESQTVEEMAQPDLSLDDIPASELEVHTAPALEELSRSIDPPSHPDDVSEDAMDVDPLPDASQSQVVEMSTFTSEAILPAPVEDPALRDIAPAVESVPIQETTAEVLDTPTDVWIAPAEPVVPASAPPLEVLEEETKEQDGNEETPVQESEESPDVPAFEVYEEEDAAGELEDVDEAFGEELDVVVEQEQVAAGPVEEHSQVQQIDEGIEIIDEKIEEERSGETSEVEPIGNEQTAQVEETEEVKVPEVEMTTREKTPAILEVESIVQEVEEEQPREISEPESPIGEQASGRPEVEPIEEVEEVQSSELETIGMEQTSTVPQTETTVEEVEEASSVPEVGKPISETSPLREPAADSSAPETSVQSTEVEAPSTTQADHSPDNRNQNLIDSDFLHFEALPQVSQEQEAPVVPGTLCSSISLWINADT